MKLKGLIFDFDGLIVDTEWPAFKGLQTVYARYGMGLHESTFGKIVGTHSHAEFHEYHTLANSLPAGTLAEDDFYAMYQAEKTSLYKHMVVLPGVREMIDQAKENGLKLAIASSSPAVWVNRFLAQFGLTGLFDQVITQDLVEHVKPEPDLFLLAQEKLGLAKDEVVIFEDSNNGVIAANRAGIHVVLIPNPVTRHLDIRGESLRVSSMAELTLDQLNLLVCGAMPGQV